MLVEGLLLIDSPYWTTLFERVEDLEISRCGIVARRTDALSHGLVGLAARNPYQRLQPCASEAAALCTRGCWLLTYALEAAALCTKGCHRMQVDLTAFNTDGFDLAGCRNVWIHDAAIWTQDSVIAYHTYLLPSSKCY